MTESEIAVSTKIFVALAVYFLAVSIMFSVALVQLSQTKSELGRVLFNESAILGSQRTIVENQKVTRSHLDNNHKATILLLKNKGIIR